MDDVLYNGGFPFSFHREEITKPNVGFAGFRQTGFDFVVTRSTKFLHLIFFSSAGNMKNKNQPEVLDTIS